MQDSKLEEIQQQLKNIDPVTKYKGTPPKNMID